MVLMESGIGDSQEDFRDFGDKIFKILFLYIQG
ncbi:hypothetical protein FUSO4_09265 [Fusobacterium necrophorum DJ-1]|uniref:Uncharacterized protein n=2 Tax=Fusobacterium necrophorum TaxID=859 RepID=A0AB73BTV6_9FUSO|nr:hypothetical protein FUSO3_10550 [Fusobacterium necrophorum BL]KDE63530.1 hypothetical protein FUSO4_09265 [Fusobacterium necrophorum DJ-1]KDE65535.1 hypothetical protein FUSO5_04515 [Fusobacterium necrophorum BFTR-1]KDE67493.1 hypothetical protein FUSO6_11065 [Fusobacterium necrophorum DAB]KDE68706.1 hypothetical protein FUSO7_12695 [Fusobacterium necrophorum BFTR-2]KDE69889.1 hypothetical protein FUSO8_10535 [Fusobacterium necrophorum DJ-2]